MKNSPLKSIGAILVGIAVGAILSMTADLIFEKSGILIRDPFDGNSSWVILMVIVYRTFFNITGAYVTAKLAPANPMKHVLILGGLGLTVSIIGTIVMWHIPPHWYPISLDILALPSAIFGGILAIRKKYHQSLNQML